MISTGAAILGFLQDVPQSFTISSRSIVFATLAVALVLFVQGRIRYDLIALGTLIFLTLLDIVPRGDAFLGFGHPAVITVAAVLVMSRGLFNSGLVDSVARMILKIRTNATLQVLTMTAIVALLSGFMNNVGALAFMLPVGIEVARRTERPASMILMPIAFGSLLGGLTTEIGTPPNIIIAQFREQAVGAPFRMFDFAPVGAGVAGAGVLFVGLVGWRLLPRRRGAADQAGLFEIEHYLGEVLLPIDSRSVGRTIERLRQDVDVDFAITAVIRDDERRTPRDELVLQSGDVLLVHGDTDAILTLVHEAELLLTGRGQVEEGQMGHEGMAAKQVVVSNDSPLVHKTFAELDLHHRYTIDLLAISRRKARLRSRLEHTEILPGDVLLLYGPTSTLDEAISDLGCLPLAERPLQIRKVRRIPMAVFVFAAGIVPTAMGWVPIEIAFVGVAGAMIATGLVGLTEIYDAIDWRVIVLLGAMIPVGEALESTRGAELIVDQILDVGAQLPPEAALIALFIVTGALSNVVNNAAAAILMAPIAVGIAEGIGGSADPFLMAVAVSSSGAFLTPIGHQSNTLVLGPGGYEFSDYVRMGAPMTAIYTVVAVALIIRVWPL